jgi:hypothetical protein
MESIDIRGMTIGDYVEVFALLQQTPHIVLRTYVPGTGDAANGLVVGNVNGYPSGLYERPWVNLAPRFGFALDLMRARGWAGLRVRGDGELPLVPAWDEPAVVARAGLYARLDSGFGKRRHRQNHAVLRPPEP